MPAAHRGCPPSTTLIEVRVSWYRAPARRGGRAASCQWHSGLGAEKERAARRPAVPGPLIGPSDTEPRKGRPVIRMPEDPGGPGLVTGAGCPASRRPARPHEQTGVRHMQARRNLFGKAVSLITLCREGPYWPESRHRAREPRRNRSPAATKLVPRRRTCAATACPVPASCTREVPARV